MHYCFQVARVEKRRKIKTLPNRRKTMDLPGPMFLYLLPQFSPFLAQNWNTMQWNSKKMGKKKCSLCLQNNSQGCTLLVFALCSLIVSLISSYPVHCVLLSFHVGTAYMYLADKYKTAHTEDGESLAFKCFRLSAIMIM